MKLNVDPTYELRDELLYAMRSVLYSQAYIRGPHYEQFVKEFAASLGSDIVCVGCGNGHDALMAVLACYGIGPGDEVICPAHNVAFTGIAIARTGATPVFVDVSWDTMLIDPAAVAAAITPKTKGVIPVHLYGHMAPMADLRALCDRHGLFLIEDACQAYLSSESGALAGTVGDAAVFSFYPTKNLAALGDGGAVVTRDRDLAQRVASYCDSGRVDRYRHTTLGINSRLDDLHAAILTVRLREMERYTQTRERRARAYHRELQGVVIPLRRLEYRHVYHLYAVRHPDRDRIMAKLNEAGVPSISHYPIPAYLQPCFEYLGLKEGMHPVSDSVAEQVFSIPLHPAMTDAQQEEVIHAVNKLT